MEDQIAGSPDSGLLKIQLDPGESLVSCAADILTRSGNLSSSQSNHGQTLLAKDEPGTVTLAPPMPGQIEKLELQGAAWVIARRGCLAHTPGIRIDKDWVGTALFHPDPRFSMIRVFGHGICWFSAFGEILRSDFDDELIADITHLIAFPDDLDYRIEPAKGITAGRPPWDQPLYCRFKGRGTVFLQTRSEPSMIHRLLQEPRA